MGFPWSTVLWSRWTSYKPDKEEELELLTVLRIRKDAFRRRALALSTPHDDCGRSRGVKDNRAAGEG